MTILGCYRSLRREARRHRRAHDRSAPESGETDVEDLMKITAAIARSAGQPLEIAELELDEPRTTEVRVRMVATGVCHTDALVRDQALPTPLPVVLGHEGAGIVDEVGSGRHYGGARRSRGARLQLVRRLRCMPRRASGVLRQLSGTELRRKSPGWDDIAPRRRRAGRQPLFRAVELRLPRQRQRTLGRESAEVGAAGTARSARLRSVYRCRYRAGTCCAPDAGSSIAIFGAGAVGCAALLAAIAGELLDHRHGGCRPRPPRVCPRVGRDSRDQRSR